jgi:uncharacterized membrane protein
MKQGHVAKNEHITVSRFSPFGANPFAPELVLLLVALICFVLSLLPAQSQRIDVGTDYRERAYLAGLYRFERANHDTTYRWADGNAKLDLPTGQLGPLVLEGRWHARPGLEGQSLPLTISLSAGQQVQFEIPEQYRVYRILAQPDSDGHLRAYFQAPTFVPEGDDREIAFALDAIGARALGSLRMPAWPVIFEELLVVVALLTLSAQLGLGQRRRLWLGASLILLIAALNYGLRLWITTALHPIALTAVLLSFATYLALPRLQSAFSRSDASAAQALGLHALTFSASATRWLWTIVLASVGLRLVGSYAPGYEAHDLDIQTELFTRLLQGTVYITAKAHEWAGGTTFYPPGPYLLLQPLLLLFQSPGLTLQVAVAIIDGFSPFLLALIARRLGFSQRGALVTAMLLAALPTQITGLWWGFFTNVVAQSIVLFVVWALLEYLVRPNRLRLSFLVLAGFLGLTAHVGVLLMGGTMIAITLLYPIVCQYLQSREQRWKSPESQLVRPVFFTLFAVGLAVLALYVSVFVLPMFMQAFTIADTRSERDPARSAAFRAYVIDIQAIKWWRGMLGLPLVLWLPGLILLWRQLPSLFGRGLILAWSIVPGLFYLIDVVFLVQVRYVYFAAPICMLTTTFFLERMARHRVGRFVYYAVVVAIVVTGTFLWLEGALLDSKPSVVPLTH